MRIAVDARCLNTAHVRGMGKALFSLLAEAATDGSSEFVLLGDEPRAPAHLPTDAPASWRVWETRGHRYRAWEQFALPRAATSLGCDLLHCVGTWCPLWQPVPTVVTVHDTLPWSEERPSPYLRRLLPAAYRKARAIVTVSENSRRDIIRLWPDLADKISVVPWGIHPAYLQRDLPPPSAAGIRSPYLLYFGGEIARKRLGWAIRVWEALREPDLQLVVCGLDPRNHDVWRQSVDPSMRDRFLCLGFVPEEALPGLYAHAQAVLYPTLYEGFGFPALESQAVGTPVLMSPLGSLAELAGPGAILLPPNDLEAWVAACRRVVGGDRPPAESARRWAARFTWKAALVRTTAVYRQALAA